MWYFGNSWLVADYFLDRPYDFFIYLFIFILIYCTVDSTYNKLGYKEFRFITNHFQETCSGP